MAGSSDAEKFPTREICSSEFQHFDDGSVSFEIGSSWTELENLFNEFITDPEERGKQLRLLLQNAIELGCLKDVKVNLKPRSQKVIDLSDAAIAQLTDKKGE